MTFCTGCYLITPSSLHPFTPSPLTPTPQELQKFARYIVSGFFHMAGKNPLLFAELLFWKTSRDCYELTEGYGALEREKYVVKGRVCDEWRGRVCDVWRMCDEWRGGCVMCGGCVMSGGEGVWCVEEGWCMEECVENKLNMAMPVTSSLSPSPPPPLTPLPLTQGTSSAQFNVDARTRGGTGRTV